MFCVDSGPGDDYLLLQRRGRIFPSTVGRTGRKETTHHHHQITARMLEEAVREPIDLKKASSGRYSSLLNT
jgi:hypothetical protein